MFQEYLLYLIFFTSTDTFLVLEVTVQKLMRFLRGILSIYKRETVSYHSKVRNDIPMLLSLSNIININSNQLHVRKSSDLVHIIQFTQYQPIFFFYYPRKYPFSSSCRGVVSLAPNLVKTCKSLKKAPYFLSHSPTLVE